MQFKIFGILRVPYCDRKKTEKKKKNDRRFAYEFRSKIWNKWAMAHKTECEQNANERDSRRKSTPFKIPNYKQLVNPVKNAHTHIFQPICRFWMNVVIVMSCCALYIRITTNLQIRTNAKDVFFLSSSLFVSARECFICLARRSEETLLLRHINGSAHLSTPFGRWSSSDCVFGFIHIMKLRKPIKSTEWRKKMRSNPESTHTLDKLIFMKRTLWSWSMIFLAIATKCFVSLESQWWHILRLRV